MQRSFFGYCWWCSYELTPSISDNNKHRVCVTCNRSWYTINKILHTETKDKKGFNMNKIMCKFIRWNCCSGISPTMDCCTATKVVSVLCDICGSVCDSNQFKPSYCVEFSKSRNEYKGEKVAVPFVCILKSKVDREWFGSVKSEDRTERIAKKNPLSPFQLIYAIGQYQMSGMLWINHHVRSIFLFAHIHNTLILHE